MPSVRLNSLTLQGFRCFRSSQTLDLSAPVCAVLASNSQGKTSLAEGVEFLLTGEIVRRQLMASAQDEFADSLRNVHLSPQDPVYVEASLLCADGIGRTVRRTLVRDYGRGNNPNCETKLEIAGQPATDADLAAHGCVLSPPPLRAPVLAQHTLGYLFSARPQERAEYFRALLEVTDLEELRATAASLEAEAKPADTPAWTKLSAASAVSELKPFLGPFLIQVPSTDALQFGLRPRGRCAHCGGRRNRAGCDGRALGHGCLNPNPAPRPHPSSPTVRLRAIAGRVAARRPIMAGHRRLSRRAGQNR